MDDMDDLDTFRDHTPKIRAKDITCKKSRKLKVMKAYQKFIHACTCNEPNCDNAGCDEMKSTVVHFKMCTRTPKKECNSCRQLLALCHYHAKRSQDCESKQCVVPYCAKMKHLMKLKRKARRAARREREAEMASTSTAEINENWEVNSISDSDSDSNSVVVVNQEASEQQEPAVAEPVTSLPVPQVGFTSFSNTTTTSSAPSVIPESTYRIPTITSPMEIERNIPNVPFLDDPQSEAQLKMLLRAHKCLTEESQGVASWPCFESNCGVMKQVLKHIYSCRIGTLCTVLHCASSKALLNHWSNCRNTDCQLCMRVRATQGRYNGEFTLCYIFELMGFGSVAAELPFVERTETFETNEVANQTSKDWQRSIYPGVREHMVKKIIGIVPMYVRSPSPNDLRLRNLLTYAKQAEIAMFNKANSTEEYFRLVSEAANRVQQEMRRKWYLRRRHSLTTNDDYSNIPQVPTETDNTAQPVSTTSNQARREMLRAFLESAAPPPNPDHHREMLRALKSNPQLMTDFIRGRGERATASRASNGPWTYNTGI